MAQWYYTQNGQQAGPLDEAQLKGLMASGQISPSDMVWRDGMTAWQPATAVPELSAAAAAQVPPLNYGGYAPAQPLSGGVSYRKDAQTAMICSIVGAVCCVILGIIGLVQGTKAKNKMRASGNMDGEGMATAAIVIGWVSIGIAIIGFTIRMMAMSAHRSF
jgi:hypothetical protein